MWTAALAALLTAAASYPRLASWDNVPAKTWLLLWVLLLSAYILWSFVFAWHEKESGRKVFTFEPRPRLWLTVTAAGIGAAAVLYFAIDPLSRQIAPLQFPKDFNGWLANLLFTLGFEQLFVCFAPFAFFVRLAHRRDVAFILTVLFGVLILCLQLSAADQLVLSALAVKLLVARIAVNSLALWFYLQGGLWTAWWWSFLINTRHLFGLP